MNDSAELKRMGTPGGMNLRLSGFFALLGLIGARLLEPAVDGVGTHRQLGLPACPMLTLSGLPCPFCGLTTSLALAVRGEWTASLRVQPLGLFVLLTALTLVCLNLPAIYRRIDFDKLVHSRRGTIFVYTFLFILLLSWFYKIASLKFTLFN
jgi:hypothetical protein